MIDCSRSDQRMSDGPAESPVNSLLHLDLPSDERGSL